MSNEPPPEEKLPLRRRFLPTTLAGKAALATAFALIVILIIVWMFRLFGPQNVALSHAVSVPHRIVEVALVIVIPFVLYWGIRRWNQVIEGEYPDIDRAWEAGIKALEAKGVAPSDYPLFLVLGSADEQTESRLMEALDTDLSVHGVPDAAGVTHALQWYMSSDAIYLFCPGASSLSALMGRWTTPSMKTSVRRGAMPASSPTSGSPSKDLSKVELPKIERVAKAPPKSGTVGAKPETTALKKESSMRSSGSGGQPGREQPQPYLGTIQHHSMDSSPQEGSPRETAAVPRGPSAFDIQDKPQRSSGGATSDALRPAPRYQGTISFDQDQPAGQQPAGQQPAGRREPVAGSAAASPPSDKPRPAGGPSRDVNSAGGDRSESPAKSQATAPKKPSVPLALPMAQGNKKVALPASLDTSDQLPRLQYVCKLLRRARRPTCGINGVVTLIPFGLSRVGPLQLSAIAQSARGDIETVQETLGVRSPVTAVLVGLEQDKGFTELVRRLQAGLLSRRLGGRFDLRSRPTPEELNTHSDRLCDAFEDWVYRLFSREDGLAQQRGNRKLYALTCKIRHELKPRLRIVLGQAFGCESSEEAAVEANDESFFFSGCYFAASGASTGQPAFVKGVLKDKLIDEQAKVQWTKTSRRRQRLFDAFSLLGWIAVVVLVCLLALRFLIWN